MASREGFGGKCPNCAQVMMQLWSSHSTGYMYDACPFCGFAYSNGGPDNNERGSGVFETVLSVYSCLSLEQLRAKHNILAAKERDPLSGCYPGVFDYDGDSEDEIRSCVWKAPNHELVGELLAAAYEKGLLEVDIFAHHADHVTVSKELLEADGVHKHYSTHFGLRLATEDPSPNYVHLGSVKHFRLADVLSLDPTQDASYLFSQGVIRLAMGINNI